MQQQQQTPALHARTQIILPAHICESLLLTLFGLRMSPGNKAPAAGSRPLTGRLAVCGVRLFFDFLCAITVCQTVFVPSLCAIHIHLHPLLTSTQDTRVRVRYPGVRESVPRPPNPHPMVTGHAIAQQQEVTASHRHMHASIAIETQLGLLPVTRIVPVALAHAASIYAAFSSYECLLHKSQSTTCTRFTRLRWRASV